jgi:hypothetical protein
MLVLMLPLLLAVQVAHREQCAAAVPALAQGIAGFRQGRKGTRRRWRRSRRGGGAGRWHPPREMWIFLLLVCRKIMEVEVKN